MHISHHFYLTSPSNSRGLPLYTYLGCLLLSEQSTRLHSSAESSSHCTVLTLHTDISTLLTLCRAQWLYIFEILRSQSLSLRPPWFQIDLTGVMKGIQETLERLKWESQDKEERARPASASSTSGAPPFALGLDSSVGSFTSIPADSL
ncbi:hypothetical protein NM688_g595 [Phlebia brevispora]|uniref:Uncharacterized protein n=1 Tax=Phlebia brevispora TaxID=194682 RepID=A0ACC1TDX2_9APHY|nr:hypothetical protein NM688_g595 [Phlebia brevispora]